MFGRLGQELWVGVLAIIIVVGVLTSHGLLVAFGLVGVLVGAVSSVWNRLSLRFVYYERHLDHDRAMMGEAVTLTVALTNRKPIPLPWVRVEDQMPHGLRVLDAGGQVLRDGSVQILWHSTSLAAYERVRWTYMVVCDRRGLYRLGPARIESGDLFGFFRSEARVDRRESLLVYPSTVPLRDLGVPALRPMGDVRSGPRWFQDPSRPALARDYQRGDPLRAVDWKLSARLGRLQVRNFDPSSTVMVMLVATVETARPWEGYSPVLLERVITAAASVAAYAVEHQFSLGLFSNGAPMLVDRPMVVPPSRNADQLTVVLEALATISPVVMSPMARMLAEHSRRFPLGASLVVVAALVTPELRDVLGQAVARGQSVTLLYVGDDPLPDLPTGLATHNMKEYFVRAEFAHEFGPR